MGNSNHVIYLLLVELINCYPVCLGSQRNNVSFTKLVDEGVILSIEWWSSEKKEILFNNKRLVDSFYLPFDGTIAM